MTEGVAHRETNIQSHRIRQGQWPHRHAEFDRGAIDDTRGHTLIEQIDGL